MYPLSAMIVGCDAEALPQLKTELSNAMVRVEAEFPNVGDAVHAIDALRRSSAECRLLILILASTSELESLRRLSSSHPGWPILALVGEDKLMKAQGEVIVDLMRAGVSQILSLPIVGREFKLALDRIAEQFYYSLRGTKVIAVAGVSGGSGATTVALNLAFEIADRHELRCVLVELSLRMGVVASHLNLRPVHSIVDLLRDVNRTDPTMIHQSLIRVADQLQLLPGPTELALPVATSPFDVARVVAMLRNVADVIILDVPCTYDDLYFETLTAANQVVMIGEQKLPSIRAMKMVREAIKRPARTEHLVVNRFDQRDQVFSIDRLLKPLGVSTLHTIARDDSAMSNAMGRGCTLRLAAPRSAALADIVQLTDLVLDLKPPTRIKSAGLFGRLGRALANS